MITEKKKELLESTYDKVIHVGFCLIPYEDLSSIFARDMIAFGTTKDELMRTFDEMDALFKSQFEQMGDIIPVIKRERIATQFSSDENQVIISEFVEMTMKTEEFTNTLNVRTSAVLNWVIDKWIFVHWHASSPVNTENDHWHFDEWKKENERLQVLIDEQTADLKNKHRELEIEAALERIRSRALAMQSSDELHDVAFELRKQMGLLGRKDLEVCAIHLYEEHKDYFESWAAMYKSVNEEELIATKTLFPNSGSLIIDEMMDMYRSNQNEYVIVNEGLKADQWFEILKEYAPEAFAFITEIAAAMPVDDMRAYWAMADFSGGSLVVVSYEYPDEDTRNLLKKAANVFGLAYKRFKDLKLAEHQSRESRIELSLERIRAQVASMQESSDLLDIVVTMRSEFVSLGHEAHYFWHMRWLPHRYEKAMTSGDGTKIGMVMSLPRHIHGDIQPVAEWEQGSEPIYVLAMDAETAVDYVDKMITLGDFERVDPHAPTLDDVRNIGGLTFVMARTTHGEIGYSLPGVVPQPPIVAVDTLKRFASVFDLAYRRFEDLKIAEQQHRIAQVDLSLERVRARSMAMHNTSELTEVIKTVDDQFKELKVNNSGGAFIVINKDLENGFSCWGAGGVGNYVRKVDIPFLESPIYSTLNDNIVQGIPFFTEHYDEDEKYRFFRHLFSHAPFNATPIERQESLLSIPDGYCRSCVVFENTSIFIINHHGIPFSDEENAILKQMGRVFEQAFTRYLDIEKAELQALRIREERDRLELTLNELHTTQDQLIQREKLASLGQLTAGIAHEIKNPLNFVNNFSEVSLEMIDEAMEEARKASDNFHVQEALDILTDIKSNLTKIHEHGSRADGIVKSMLMHSRGGSGSMEPTNLNHVVREYVNLAFHGMRAGKDPINVDIELDLDDSVEQVPLIAEDFSRVILNLCNNAFDAMREKGQGTRDKGEDFAAKLSVRTKRDEDKTFIEIEDNGVGIPDDIKDKILQPFFTTKKGTQGTGLGLSITHDIIKAHGGSLDVQSIPGQTVFTIQLA